MDQLAPDYCISLSRRLCPTTAFDFGVERRCSDFWIVAHASILDVTLISHQNSLLTPSRTFTHLKHHRWSPAENSNMRSPNMIFSLPSLISPRLRLYSASFPPPFILTMLHPPTDAHSIQLPTASAFSLCDGLLRMAHCLIVKLPESELRDVRYTLDTLSTRVDQLLDSAELDLSLNFDGLVIDPGKC